MISSYRFEDLPGGFRITRDGYKPFSTQLEGVNWLIAHDFHQHKVPMYGYQELMKQIGEHFSDQNADRSLARTVIQPIRDWMTVQTRRAIGKQVHQRWQQAVSQADEQVRGLCRRVFSYTLSSPDEKLVRLVLDDPYLHHDVTTNRAAAWVLAGPYYQNRPVFRPSVDLSPEDQMRNWRSMYSDTRKPYRNLNRQLDHLPGGISGKLLRRMYLLHVERPLYTRVEFAVAFGAIAARMTNKLLEHDQALWRSSPDVVRRALDLVRAHQRMDRIPQGLNGIIQLADYILDYPNKHTGNFYGLAEKSIEWHLDLIQGGGTYQDHGRVAPALMMSAPDNPHLTLLDTESKLVHESQVMGHCVAWYADKMVSGQFSYWHVDFEGQQATIEVDMLSQQVVQALGPKNCENQASRYGAASLKRWIKGYPAITRNGDGVDRDLYFLLNKLYYAHTPEQVRKLLASAEPMNESERRQANRHLYSLKPEMLARLGIDRDQLELSRSHEDKLEW